MFLAELAPQARRLFEYLLGNPGRTIHWTELVDEDRRRPVLVGLGSTT